MQRRLNKNKNIMNTKVLLLGAVVTAFTLTSFAGEPLLSPRAKDNQIKVVTSSISTQGGTVSYVAATSSALLSPRAKDNQTKVVSSSIETQGGTVTYYAPASNTLLSPRAKDNQTKTVPPTIAPLK